MLTYDKISSRSIFVDLVKKCKGSGHCVLILAVLCGEK